MRSFDIFRKIRDDIETSTWIGGLYTLLAFIIGGLLIYAEIRNYIQGGGWIKEFKVESDDAHSRIKLEFDIIMKRAPCYLLSVYVQDEIGHKFKPDTVNNIRLATDGSRKANQSYYEESALDYKGSASEKRDIFESVDQRDGCHIIVRTLLDKAPGSIAIGFDDKMDDFLDVYTQRSAEFLNLDYKLNSIYFGEVSTFVRTIKEFNGEPLNYSPYLGLDTGDNKTLRSYTSFFKVVPTKFLSDKSSIESLQYSQSFRETPIAHSQYPSVTFKYDVSPVTMIFRKKESDIYHSIVQVCAVVGGIFALMGILNSLTWESLNYMKA